MKQKTISYLGLIGSIFLIFNYLYFLYDSQFFSVFGWILILPFFFNLYKKQRAELNHSLKLFFSGIIGLTIIALVNFIIFFDLVFDIDLIGYENNQIINEFLLSVELIIALLFFLFYYKKQKKGILKKAIKIALIGITILIIHRVGTITILFNETNSILLDRIMFAIPMLGYPLILLFFITLVKKQFS